MSLRFPDKLVEDLSGCDFFKAFAVVVESGELGSDHAANFSLGVFGVGSVGVVAELHAFGEVFVCLDLLAFEVALGEAGLDLEFCFVVDIAGSWPTIVNEKFHSIDNDSFAFIN